jgi:hypothetical protein
VSMEWAGTGISDVGVADLHEEDETMKTLAAEARRLALGRAERAVLGALMDIILVVVNRRLRKAISRRAVRPATGRLPTARPDEVRYQSSDQADSDRPNTSRQP